MSWETLRAAADLSLQTVTERFELLFYGGEPLLELPLIQRVVSYVREARGTDERIRFALITNGILLDDETAAFLSRYGFIVELSFDGIAPAQRIRGERTFSTLDRLLKRLADGYPRWFQKNLNVNITVTSPSIPYLADSFDYFVSRGVRHININPVFTHDAEWTFDHIDALDRQFARIYRSSLGHDHRTGETPLVLFRTTGSDPKAVTHTGIMCNVYSGNALAIDVDGRVYGCVAFAESFQKPPPGNLNDRLATLRLGDLRDGAFPQRLAAHPVRVHATGIFTEKSKKYSSYRRCADCDHIATCAVCPASIAFIPGNSEVHRISDFQCAFQYVAQQYAKRFSRRGNTIRT
jgi:uncharacterized protein